MTVRALKFPRKNSRVMAETLICEFGKMRLVVRKTFKTDRACLLVVGDDKNTKKYDQLSSFQTFYFVSKLKMRQMTITGN